MNLVPLSEAEKALVALLIKDKLSSEPESSVYRAYEAIGVKVRKKWTPKSINSELDGHSVQTKESQADALHHSRPSK